MPLSDIIYADKEVVPNESDPTCKKTRSISCCQQQIRRVSGCEHPDMGQYHYATSGGFLQVLIKKLQIIPKEDIDMSKRNCIRTGCKDVFHAFLVQNAEFSEGLEFPCVKPEGHVPNKMVPFSQAISCTDVDQWVHFYEDDVRFERIWNNPLKYLPILKRFRGVISPDFSLYRDMPLVMQQWNTYRGRAIAHWLQENGISVIPNIRFADRRSYAFCCDGISKGGTIAIGSHGCIKLKRERNYFVQGLDFVVNKLQPAMIVIYGTVPEDMLNYYRSCGINMLTFESRFSCSHKAVIA